MGRETSTNRYTTLPTPKCGELPLDTPHRGIYGKRKCGASTICNALRWELIRERNLKPEDAIHKAIADHLRHRGAPGLVFWHTPNDGKRSYKTASRLKKMGMRSGVSDICALHLGKFYALELKAENGRPTVEQLKFLSDVNEAGGFGCMSYGLDRALAVLESWGLLR